MGATLWLTQAATGTAVPQQDPETLPGPSFEDVLSLERVGSPRVSPDGRSIAYSLRTTDWENNRYDTEIWLAREGEEPFQLTRTQDGSSFGHRWSPDGRWLAFIADRGDEQQVYLISPRGGDARRLTDVEDGVNALEWSPDGTLIAFASADPQSKELKAREKQYGAFAVEDADFRMNHLWVVEVDGEGEPSRLTEGEFTVGGFNWAPDGQRIAFEHRPQPTPEAFGMSDISVVDLESKALTILVDVVGGDYGPIWSPDGAWVLFATMLQDSAFYRNRRLARVPASGGELEVLSEDFDENPSAFEWNQDGVWFVASQRTQRHIFKLDPDSRRVEQVSESPDMVWSASVSADGETLALYGETSTTLAEIYRTSTRSFRPQPVTDMTAQASDWPLGTREVIEWSSQDGSSIEGVLFKPADYDPSRRYPLLVSIHGGPTGTSRPVLVSAYVYPYTQWLAKGAVILMPNYRGSAAYGEEFRALNVRNLGVGDAWDVLSGVDYLIDQGIADPERMGAMGWSQGGYISAFLTTTSDVFQAISVGAGISNWMTYYVNTDIHRFTRTYLKGTPWDDPDVYAKTSPMTYITQAKTPTLIQHGEFDRRVPIPNAYELYQGLQDVGVETRLIVYKGFGHGINKPKEQLAATWHNWQWFARYIWGEQVQIPLDLEGEEEDEDEQAAREKR
jgi:dipeptidyl aminopeptidase/acylaminoacyl peptidase